MGLGETIKGFVLKPEKKDDEKERRMWENYNQVPYKQLTAEEKKFYDSAEKKYGKYGARESDEGPPMRIERGSSRQPRELSDEELKEKYGYRTHHDIINKLDRLGQKAGILRKPEDEWLEEKRIEERARRAELEGYEESYKQSRKEEGMLRGMGKNTAKAMQAKAAREQMKAEAEYAREMLKLEREKVRLAQAMSRGQGGGQQRVQYVRESAPAPQQMGPPGFNSGFDPMAGLGKFGFGGQRFSPMAGLEKIAGSRGGGMPDFSRFVNPDPTAGLSKMWGSEKRRGGRRK